MFATFCNFFSDAGNSPCFSLQPPSNTNFHLVLLRFPQGCTLPETLDANGCPEECASKHFATFTWGPCYCRFSPMTVALCGQKPILQKISALARRDQIEVSSHCHPFLTLLALTPTNHPKCQAPQNAVHLQVLTALNSKGTHAGLHDVIAVNPQMKCPCPHVDTGVGTKTLLFNCSGPRKPELFTPRSRALDHTHMQLTCPSPSPPKLPQDPHAAFS